MKKIIFIISGVILMAIVFFMARSFQATAPMTPVDNAEGPVQNSSSSEIRTAPNSTDSSKNNSVPNGFIAPLDRAKERVTKKPFGLFVTPQNSPVLPEKFRGYHVGTDFEIFPEELNAEVSVKAVCAGKLLMKKTATGYGGVAVQSCIADGQPIAVVYGHLKLSSVKANAGDELKAGDTLGILGVAYSAETSGERKHLHLGFHKGSATNILGYARNKAELSGWLDSCQYVCQ